MVLSLIEKETVQTGTATAPVKTTNVITQQDLIDLAEGRFIAMRVTDYYPEWLCEELCKKLLQLPEFARYLRAQNVGVQRTGMTFFETKGNPVLLDRYYIEAQRLCASIRKNRRAS